MNIFLLTSLQTVALILKNVISSYHHFVETFLRLLLPSMVLFILFIFKTVFIEQNTYYNVPSVYVEKNLKNFQGKMVFVADGGDLVDELVGKIGEMSGLEVDLGPGGMGYGVGEWEECAVDMCKIYGSDVGSLKGIIESTNASWKGAFMLKQTNEGIKYSFFKDTKQYQANPFLNSDDLPKVRLDDTSSNIQHLISSAIIEANINNQNTTVPGISTKKVDINLSIKTPLLGSETTTTRYNNDHIVMLVGACFFFVGIFLVTFQTHFQLNLEKRSGFRNGMSSMGMNEMSFWCSWFIYQSIICGLSIIIMIIVGNLFQISFFTRTSSLALFIIFLSTGCSMISSWMCCSTCCSSTVMTTLNSFLYLLFSVLIVLMWQDNSFDYEGEFEVADMMPNGFTFIVNSFIVPLWWLHFNPAYIFGRLCWDVSELVHDTSLYDEGTDIRFKFGDLFNYDIHKVELDIPGYDSNWWAFNPMISICLLIGLSAFSIFMTWYCDNILPKDNYRRKKACFCCSPIYWGVAKNDDYLQTDVCYGDFTKEGFVLPDLDEDILNEFRVVMNSLVEDKFCKRIPLKIVKVSKIFQKAFDQKSATTALNELTLCCGKGQCLVLCGPNGAGKTTLINILTGGISCTTGDCLVFGNSTTMNMNHAKRIIGVCPQFDIIWPELTSKMHMYLFACLKGVPLSLMNSRINELLNKVHMIKYSNQYAKTLSGGQKRRLSLAMSIIGDPKILFLDEPTSGMDPLIKRKIWNFVTEIKKDRVVVLTTHSMEEADILGDKIAILANGRLRCVGDSLHLKKRYGAGYQIDVILPSINQVPVFKQDLKTVGTLKLEKETNNQLSFSIPVNSNVDHKELAKRFLQFLENYSALGKLRDYTISHTTLEEVFIRTIHGSSDLIEKTMNRAAKGDGQELHIIIEGQADPFAIIDIAPNWKLADVRTYLNGNFGNLQDNFSFISNNVVLTKEQEIKKTAEKFIPIITIRIDTVIPVQPTTTTSNVTKSEVIPSSSIPIIPPTVQNEELVTAQNLIGQQKETIDKQNQEIIDLKKIIEDLQTRLSLLESK